MKKMKFLLLAISFLMMAGFTHAQQDSIAKQDTLSLTLQQCISIAMDESPTIRIAQRDIERVDYANKEKMSALFPAINASASYSRTLKKQKMFFDIPGFPSSPDGIEVGQDNTFAGVLSASMPIISPTLWASLKMNETDAALTMESARSSKLSLINSVTKAFYGVLLAQDSYKVFKRTYQNAAENARIIQNKFEQGAVSEFEWIRADVQVRNALTNLVSAESAINLSTLQLKMLMGIDMHTTIQPTGKLADYESLVFEQAIQLSNNSLDKNTDLNQFDLKAKQLKQSLEIQKSTWLPTLSASINYQYMSMPNDEVAFKDYYWFPTSTAGLTLSVPIFQGGSKHYKAKQLQVQIKTMDDQRENLKRSLELQAITYTDNMIKAIEKMESGKKALTQAEKALDISQKMYEVGAGTYLDVTNAELGYIQAGLSYNQSIYDFISAKSDLEKILGTTIN
ncbi:MAG: TolC family protein [Paludibacter sp.]|nr:TolC family protein [Paludibacter sp.]